MRGFFYTQDKAEISVFEKTKDGEIFVDKLVLPSAYYAIADEVLKRLVNIHAVKTLSIEGCMMINEQIKISAL